MKKMALSVGIVVLLTAFCWFTAWRVDDLCTETSSVLDQAEIQVVQGDYHGAGETAARAFQMWNRHEGFYGMALRHTESDDIGILFPGLIEAAGQKDQGEFLLRVRELKANLRHLGRMELPYLFNVL